MPFIRYREFAFRPGSLLTIQRANAILDEYEQQGYDLTLRQLYYQFVARGLIANNDREYKKLGSIVNDGRLGGKIDWNHITDRTRYVREHDSWSSPAAIIRGAANSYAIDLWADQPEHVEVWVEKDALVGVVQTACDELRVPYLSCRGYVSQSEMWQSGQRLLKLIEGGKKVTILHLGDHDPSGIDMTRDIRSRLTGFILGHLLGADGGWRERFRDWFTVDRIALTMDQIDEYQPPPNPAKLTDSRGRDYVEEYGDDSWELDALEPRVLTELIRDSVEPLIDRALMDERLEQEEEEREVLTLTSSRWADVQAFLTNGTGGAE